MHSLGAQIISFTDFIRLKPTLGKIVVTSGYFDPIHPGHISCFIESKKLGDTLVVLVDGDIRAAQKKGRSFQNIATRCSIVSGIRTVDYVIPLEIENVITVGDALKLIQPHFFTKGGDRTNSENIPEWPICKEHNITIVTNVGLGKEWSSSAFLKEWTQFQNNNKKS